MNHLEVRQTLTSLEVAEMVEKEHSHLLRDIRRYCKQMNEINENITFEGQSEINESKIGLVKTNESKIELVEFFVEDFYLDNKGEKRPCYNVTKKGCEFIAHKLTGTKGTAFTARYINRFHDMEQALQQQQPVQAELPQKEKEQYLLKDSQTWFSKNNWKMQILCRDFRWERKYLYHKILTELSDIYNLKGIEKEYVQKNGHAPVYKMELVEFYEPLQGVASRYLDYLLEC